MMKDRDKPKEELINELEKLRELLRDYEASEAQWKLEEKLLKGSEERFRSMASKADDAIVMIDNEGNISFWNNAAERMFGFTSQEAAGKELHRLIVPAPYYDAFVVGFERFKKTGEGIIVGKTYEVEAKNKNGKKFPVELTVSALKFKNKWNALGIIRDITARKQVENELKGAEERFRKLFETTKDGLLLLSKETGEIVDVNPAIVELLGYPRDEVLGKQLSHIGILKDEENIQEVIEKLKRVGLIHYADVEIAAKNGREIDTEIYLIDRASLIQCNVRDITERKHFEEHLKKWAEIFKNTRIGVVIIGSDGKRMEMMNPAFAEMHGYKVDELTGKPVLNVFAPETQTDAVETVRMAQEKGYHVQESLHIRKDGTTFPVLLTVSAVKDTQGKVVYRIINVQDISEHKKAEEIIQYQAYHDLLTGLPNRAQLLSGLRHELAQADRNGKKLAVLHLDLDRFRAINESLGHTTGDKVIRAVADRLGSLIRKSDTMARIGSDEFIVLLADLSRPEDAARFGQTIGKSMKEPLHVNGHEFYITASIGISMYPEDGTDAEVLLRNADIAVAHAKERGRGNYQFFNPAISVRTVERILLERSLRQSLEQGELEIHYQPLVSIRTGEINCLEALVRWRHPTLGLLHPAQFISLAEEIGLIASIDEWVLRTACAQNKAWQDSGYPPLCVTVNLSSQQFHQPKLVDTVSGLLRGSGLDPRYLDIEITERTAMRDVNLAVPTLRGLNEMDICLSIDDFGTGYSSLNYLKRFPVHKLKIDQSFVRGIAEDPDDQAIVNAVIAMGHSLRLRVTAEGVETEEQLSFLRSHGCDEMQGYLFSEPLPTEKVTELIASGK